MFFFVLQVINWSRRDYRKSVPEYNRLVRIFINIQVGHKSYVKKLNEHSEHSVV